MDILAPAADERVKNVEFADDVLSITLMDGRTISVPLAWYPRLLNASKAELQNWQVSGGGYGIHWPDVDEDLSTEGLLRGAPAPRQPSVPPPLKTGTEHSNHSSFREMLLEQLFLGEILREFWLSRDYALEVLRPQVDNSGYDLVLDAGSVVRHIQLKASHGGARTTKVNINLRLAQKPSGCVIWVEFDPNTLALGPFFWFGSSPGKPLSGISRLRVAKHTKGNSEGIKSERPNIREIPKSKFTEVASIEELLVLLFG